MPRLIANAETRSASLEETIDELHRIGFDPQHEGSVDHAARALQRLANDREFLGDLLLDMLAGSAASPQSGYGPQAIVLSPPRGEWFLRANIWPSERDTCLKSSGAAHFVYGAPHDHNFDFLTVGYFGPSYVSDYYEFDYERVTGWRGEAAELRFVERSALSEGKTLLYRAHRDVHSQLPPETMSVSLNILRIDPAQAWRDQYGFDLEHGTVSHVLNPTSSEAFLRCAVGLGGEEARDLAEYFGRHHPSDRMRLASFEARAMLADAAEADALWRTAEKSGSRLVAREAKFRRAEIDTEQRQR